MSDLPLPEPALYPQTLDIQHDTDPEQNYGVSRRIPHIGHTALFFAIAICCVLLSVTAVLVPAMVLHPHMTKQPGSTQMAQLAALGLMIGYVVTFAISIPVFPLMWKTSFWNGIHWTWRAAKLRWWKLLLLGLALCVFAEVADRFVKQPKEVDLLKLLNTPLAAWLTAIFGALIAPFVEEMAFRGFLLPSLATAYDWLTLAKTPEALNRWQTTTSNSLPGLILASFVSSIAFAAMHGGQLHWAFGPIVVLFCVSLALSAIRVHWRSVAASTLVHMSYNSVLFVLIFIQTSGFRHLEKLQQP